MTVSKKIRRIGNKIDQNKAQYWHCKNNNNNNNNNNKIKKGLDKVYEFNEKESGEKINKDDDKPTFNIVINWI